MRLFVGGGVWRVSLCDAAFELLRVGAARFDLCKSNVASRPDLRRPAPVCGRRVSNYKPLYYHYEPSNQCWAER